MKTNIRLWMPANIGGSHRRAIHNFWNLPTPPSWLRILSKSILVEDILTCGYEDPNWNIHQMCNLQVHLWHDMSWFASSHQHFLAILRRTNGSFTHVNAMHKKLHFNVFLNTSNSLQGLFVKNWNKSTLNLTTAFSLAITTLRSVLN